MAVHLHPQRYVDRLQDNEAYRELSARWLIPKERGMIMIVLMPLRNLQVQVHGMFMPHCLVTTTVRQAINPQASSLTLDRYI